MNSIFMSISCLAQRLSVLHTVYSSLFFYILALLPCFMNTLSFICKNFEEELYVVLFLYFIHAACLPGLSLHT
jgi:hypothetical protein